METDLTGRHPSHRGTSRTDRGTENREAPVLVTGGAGFVGSHLVEQLLAERPGRTVRILDALTYAADRRFAHAIALRPRVELIVGDVRDPEVLRWATRGCATVYHLAAESHVDRSFSHPELFDDVNRRGTLEVIAAVRASGARLVHMSTDEVTGPTREPLPEGAAFAPTTPYAASKAAGEQAVHDAADRIDARILRPTNAVGTRQHVEKLVPRFVALALAGQPLTIAGTGGQLRAFLPVRDLARAAITVANEGECGAIYNVPGRETLSVLDVAARIGRVLEIETEVTFVPDRPVNDIAYALDGSRIAALGWTQTGTLDAEIAAVAHEMESRRPLRLRVGAPRITPMIAGLRGIDPVRT